MQHSDAVLDEIEQSFERVDVNGDRHIDFQEFSNIMVEMDRRISGGSLRALFDSIDKNRDGRVSFEEFCPWCRPAL